MRKILKFNFTFRLPKKESLFSTSLAFDEKISHFILERTLFERENFILNFNGTT